MHDFNYKQSWGIMHADTNNWSENSCDILVRYPKKIDKSMDKSEETSVEEPYPIRQLCRSKPILFLRYWGSNLYHFNIVKRVQGWA